MASELIKADSAQQQMKAITHNPALRQVLLLVGVAAAVAAGVAVALWSQGPNFRPLYTGLADKDASQVVEALQKSSIPYRLEQGAVLVPADQVHDARMKLAAQGLPRGSDLGFESLQEQPGFGTSQFMETARYQHALENELARSISSLTNVQSARVHLALPKQSVFVRNRQQASASVLVNLYGGRNLEDGQVAAILHLVAASVPNLEAERVTIVDQKGRLLSADQSNRDLAFTSGQFEYNRKLEESYIRRIEEILTPIVGAGGVRAQVTADLDFSVTEQTQEKFNPEQPALRSEQVAQDQNVPGGATTGGIPGALSNQPPGASSVPETAAAKPAATKPAAAPAAEVSADTAAAQPLLNTSSRATRNYELDKVISHTRQPSGAVRRLSVAVVVDERQSVNDKGEVTRAPLAPEELERITGLVKDAVGFDAKRGDSVNVINTAFTLPPAAQELPEPPIYRQPWVWDVAKQAGAALAVLLLIFGVLRPLLRDLTRRPLVAVQTLSAGGESGTAYGQQSAATTQLGGGAPLQLSGPGSYENQIDAIRGMTSQDPKRAAQVVKSWVSADG